MLVSEVSLYRLNLKMGQIIGAMTGNIEAIGQFGNIMMDIDNLLGGIRKELDADVLESVMPQPTGSSAAPSPVQPTL
jgi:hypothetical protein